MISGIVSGLLTFAFWTLVARHSGAEVVGAASAELATVTFLAFLGSLNMINVFARFLPEAGGQSRRLVCTGDLAATAASCVIAVLFLLTPASQSLVVGGAAGRVGFVGLVVAMSVFVIQDGGLIGLGRAVLVPVENILVSLARIALLAVAAVTVTRASTIIVAWAIPLVVAVVVVNVLIIGRWTPALHGQPSLLPPRRELRKFVAIESLTTAVSSSVSAFLPAIVALVMGQAAAGYFYVPWLISSTAGLLLTAILISMVRESVARPTEAAAILHRSLLLCAAIVVAGTLGCIVLGPLVLSILGNGFATGSGSLLVWIGLSLPATAVGLLYWSVCLIRRRPWPMFAMNVAISVMMIGGVMILGAGPVYRVGALYCGVQWVIAIAVAGPVLAALREASRGGAHA